MIKNNRRRGGGQLPRKDEPTQVRSKGYAPIRKIFLDQPRDLPPFSFWTVRQMLWDPGVRLNLQMRAAPIFGIELAYQDGTDENGKPKYTPGVKSKNPAVAAWVKRQIDTIWHNYLPSILKAQTFGWSGGEVTLRLSEYNLIEIDKLIPFNPGDLRLLKRDGCRSGIRVNRIGGSSGYVDLNFPYSYFHSFRPEDGEDYGTSILLGAYSSWADKWFQGGALDVRRLFMRKDAYRGAQLEYPSESIYVEGSDTPVPARDVAMQVVEQVQSGGVITMPSDMDQNGNPKWRFKEATVASNPQHIMQYPKDCDDEIRAGMEIPDDVISNDGSGAWAGKRIPLSAFYAGLDTWVVEIFSDLRYTLEPLIKLNWGEAIDFEICHKPLALMAMEQQGEAGGSQQQSPPSFATYEDFRPRVAQMSLMPPKPCCDDDHADIKQQAQDAVTKLLDIPAC